MGGQRLDRGLDEIVHRFPVCAIWAVLEEPPRLVRQRIIGAGNGIGELDVVALIRRARRPLWAAVEGDHHVGRQFADRLGDLRPELGSIEIWLSGKSQNSTSSTPTIADDVRCSRSRSGRHSSGGMPGMPTSPRQASA